MRVIVPLQGVVQGRGGLVLGSAIPCALFYFLQLYLRRRNRSAPTPPPAPEQQVPDVHVLSRSLSRTHLSPRGAGGPAYVSGRASSVAKSGDSPCDVGLRKVSEDPYDEARNPDGVIQLGLAENKVGLFCFVLGFALFLVQFSLSLSLSLSLTFCFISSFVGFCCSYRWTWFEIGWWRMRGMRYWVEEEVVGS
jgi:hypothetical protein